VLLDVPVRGLQQTAASSRPAHRTSLAKPVGSGAARCDAAQSRAPAVHLSPATERRLATFGPPLLVALLAMPFVVGQNAWWGWSTTYWLLERQAAHVSAHGVPTLFLHTQAATFNDFYVFYAGFTFSLLAYPAALVGAWPVYAATCVLAPVAGYLGIWWTARNLGLSRRLAILPALAFATTPYLLSDLYGRGAWAELVAANAVAVLLGGLTALLWHPDRHRGRTLGALTGGAAVLAGTHNLTLLMSALVVPLIVAALLPIAPRAGGLGGVARTLGSGVVAVAVGVGLTGAWLVPDLWLGRDTFAADPSISLELLRQFGGLARASNVLSPWPAIPHAYAGQWIYAQAPVPSMAWALVAAALVAWSARRGAARRLIVTLATLAGIAAGLLVLIVHPLWWNSLPRLLQTIQFPYRLVSYVAIVVALGVALALTALRPGRARRGLVAALVVAIGAQGAMATYVVLRSEAGAPLGLPAPRRAEVHAEHEPAAFSGPTIAAQYQFQIVDRPAGPPPTGRAQASIRDRVTSDAATVFGRGAVGDRLVVPVVWSPLVRVEGDAHVVGRAGTGLAVVAVTRADAHGRWRATARPACTGLCLGALTGRAPWPLLAGRLLTLLSALAIVGVCLVGRRRPGRPYSPASRSIRARSSFPRPADTARAARSSVSGTPRAVARSKSS
jgi:hypothetical protein